MSANVSGQFIVAEYGRELARRLDRAMAGILGE